MAFSRSLRRVNWLGLIVAGGVLATWELAVDVKIVDFEYLPSPTGILAGLIDLAQVGDLSAAAGHTLGVFLTTWAISLVLGTACGLLIGLSDVVSRWTMASVEVFRSLPTIALIPAALLVLGPGTLGEVIVTTYAATWPMLINVSGGVRSVHPRLYDLAAMMRLSRWKRLVKIILPASAPSLLVGARLSMGISLIVTVVAEMIGFPFGIGYGIVEQQNALRSSQMWGYVLVAGTFGWLFNWALVKVARLLLPGASHVLTEAQ